MKIQVDKTGTQNSLLNLLTAAESDSQIKAHLILACDANEFEKEKN